ncbi:serine/threonine protein kinase [Schlesneria paludicola]|uniref:serine/threonine protein kinase n=1 Tax=Schlesneria paludicola TaxID=360056 RepID=UPI00029A74DF|nr:serine/threonine-protein kinase [Schlesneria paludicola]
MSVSVDGFLKHLSDSGVMSSADISNVEAQIPAAKRSRDADSLARELVRLKMLTPFQADNLNQTEPAPLLIGNYVIQDKIGSGGMGVVYKAQHRRMKRTVAVKVLSSDSLRDTDTVKRFLREAEAAAKLSHPNIVAAFDADEANGIPFLAMEFVEGQDLSACVRTNGPMSLDQALDCILQAAQGLEHAHQQGLVHRDIKPANILITPQGTVKILDMGLARLHTINADTASSGAGEITQAGSVVGTVDFMSPEQALDSIQVDPSSDIYSLGATLYYLMTGKAMYELPSLMARLIAHRESPLPSICALRPDAPPQIDTVFRKMVAKKKEDRYESMTAVIRQLRDWKNAVESGSATMSSPELIVPKSVMDVIFDDN